MCIGGLNKQQPKTVFNVIITNVFFFITHFIGSENPHNSHVEVSLS